MDIFVRNCREIRHFSGFIHIFHIFHIFIPGLSGWKDSGKLSISFSSAMCYTFSTIGNKELTVQVGGVSKWDA